MFSRVATAAVVPAPYADEVRPWAAPGVTTMLYGLSATSYVDKELIRKNVTGSCQRERESS